MINYTGGTQSTKLLGTDSHKIKRQIVTTHHLRHRRKSATSQRTYGGQKYFRLILCFKI